MPASTLRLPYRTFYPCLCTVIVVDVIVDVHPSSHSFHMYISYPDWRWGKIWDISPLVDIKGLMFSSALWVTCMMLTSGRITRGPCEVLILLLHGVSTFM